ncbi:hypothetical protein C8F04DRAFT_1175950 [Mycena alexandri]|uniref:Uncharacterized protein n=1 Tax=Mycena alexandri TaxID=1745969 RepID=A0AAD6XF02_9AGAR|nr:hypothetical protein C8F04DRAFT_1175950 [Mycena alexandri]
MARTKQVYVRSDRIPPPGGWPAHVKVIQVKQPGYRANRAMHTKLADPTVDVGIESDSETDEHELDDEEDDGDVDSQDSDDEEDDGVLDSQDSDGEPSAEDASDVDSGCQRVTPEVEEVGAGGAEGRDVDEEDSSLSSLSSDDDQPLTEHFLTEHFDGPHLLTTEEVAVICGVNVESLPHASSLPPLFCASLAVCSGFSQTFAERFPGVHLLTAEELSVICGVNVDSLPPFSSLPPLFRELGRPFSEDNSALRLYNASEAALLCGCSLEAHSSSLRQEVAASDEQRCRADATRALNATRRQMAITSPTRRRSSRFQPSVGPSTSSQFGSISTTETAGNAITPSSVKHYSALLSVESTLSSTAKVASPAMDIDAATFVAPGTDYCDSQVPLSEARLFPGMAPHIQASIESALGTFWGFDNHLFLLISNWCLDYNVHSLGSGLVEPPIVVIAWFAAYNSACDKCSRASNICAKAVGQPGCTGCINSKVRCSLQETYLFEKTKDKFDGKRYEFDAFRSAKRPRRRTAEEPRRRTAAHGASSTGGARGSPGSPRSTIPPPPTFQLQNPQMPYFAGPSDASADAPFPAMPHPHAFSNRALTMTSFNGSGAKNPAYFTDQHIDPVLLQPLSDLMDTTPLDPDNIPVPAISHIVHQGVQTDDLPHSVDDAVPPVPGAVVLPDVPLDTLDIQELCNFFTEMVAQCINAIFNGHFEMLVALSGTKHRLRASTDVPPDVLQHFEQLFMECHSCLSRMLARLDEGRRSAPDVFASTISSSLIVSERPCKSFYVSIIASRIDRSGSLSGRHFRTPGFSKRPVSPSARRKIHVSSGDEFEKEK